MGNTKWYDSSRTETYIEFQLPLSESQDPNCGGQCENTVDEGGGEITVCKVRANVAKHSQAAEEGYKMPNHDLVADLNVVNPLINGRPGFIRAIFEVIIGSEHFDAVEVS